MAIVMGQRSGIGFYEYQCNGVSSWTEVNVTNQKPLGKKSDKITVIYLKPTDKLRFNVLGM